MENQSIEPTPTAEAPTDAREERAQESDYWLTKAPVSKAIAHMAIPAVLGMAAMAIYNFTDTLFVGMLGNTAALAALPLFMPIMGVFMALSTFLEVGAGTFVSRMVGSKNLAAARAASSFSVMASVAGGLALGALAIVFMDPIMRGLGANDEIAGPLGLYLLAYCLGAPAVVLNMVAAQLLRCVGESKRASAGIVASAVINIALDPLFIFALDLGIGGAALATVLANTASCTFFLSCLRGNTALSFRPSDCKLSLAEFADIAKIGASGLIMIALMSASSLLFNNIAVRYGTAVVAGFGVAQNTVQLAEIVAMGLYEGVVPLIGGAWGAAMLPRLREIVAKTALCLLVFCGATCAALILFGSTVVSWFSSDATVIEIGTFILFAQVLAVTFESGTGLITGVFQGCRKGVFANALACAKGLALPVAVVLGSVLFGLNGVIWSLAAAAVATFGIGVLLLAVSFGRPAKPLSCGSVQKEAGA